MLLLINDRYKKSFFAQKTKKESIHSINYTNAKLNNYLPKPKSKYKFDGFKSS